MLKRILAVLAGLCGASLLAATFVYNFMIYFILKLDPRDGALYDGLGRRLTETPWWARGPYGEFPYWPGLEWRLIDTVGSLAVAAASVALLMFAHRVFDSKRQEFPIVESPYDR